METIEIWAISVLLKISIQAGILAVLIWVITRFAGNAPASLRHALWLLVVVKFFVPPFAYLPSQLAVWQVENPTLGRVSVTAVQSPMIPWTAGVPVEPVGEVSEGGMKDGVSSVSRLTWSSVALRIWAVGAALMLVLLIIRHRRQVRLVGRSQPAGEEIERLLTEAGRNLGIKRLPRLRLSEECSTPVLVGLLKPVILLPPRIAEACSAPELQAILLHELAHVKRRDVGVLWLYEVARLSFYFHPCLWFAGRELRKERELACDEMVLSRSRITAGEYAAGYLAALKLANGVPSNQIAMAEPFDVEKRRLEKMLRNVVPKLSWKWIVACLAVVCAGLPTFVGLRAAGDEHVSSNNPTPALISAALLKQEALCGGSLEVEYTNQWRRGSGIGPDDTKTRSYRYIRTPELLFAAESRVGTARKLFTSYDRQSEAYKRLIDNGPSDRLGQISEGIENPFARQDFFETIRFPLHEGPLCDRMAVATVLESMESVDGYNCWRTEIPTSYPTLQKYVVWVDPGIGFNPRKIEFVKKVGPSMVVSFGAYEEITDGCWFPRRQTMEYWSGDVKFTQVNTVDRVAVGRTIPKAELAVDFPAGTEVYDAVLRARYTVP